MVSQGIFIMRYCHPVSQLQFQNSRMSLELCWTEQLGFNHCQSPQGTDIYRRGEKVKCYQYPGVLGAYAKGRKYISSPPYFAAVCWTNVDYCPVPKVEILSVHELVYLWIDYKGFLREFIFSKWYILEKQSVLGGIWQEGIGCVCCTSAFSFKVAQGTGRTSNNLLKPVPTKGSSCCSQVTALAGTVQLFLLPHIPPELCWERQRRY